MDCTTAVVKNSVHPKMCMLSGKNQCDLSEIMALSAIQQVLNDLEDGNLISVND